MTARVAVVSNSGLGFGLSGGDLEVVGIDQDEVDEWLSSTRCDVLVIGLTDPGKALDVVERARASPDAVPLLLVTSDAPGWDSLRQLEGDALGVLTLPITGPSFVAAINGLLRPVPIPTPQPPEVPHVPQVAQAAVPDPVPLPVPTVAPAPVRTLTETRRAVVLRERLAGRQLSSSRDDDLRASIVVPEPSPTRRRTRAQKPLARPASQDADSAAAPTPARATTVQVAPDLDAQALVRALLSRVTELDDVRDSATGIVAEAAELTDAVAGVLLLPDGDVWRVSGAVGLRPLELRYSLAPDSWLVSTVVRSTKGVIVEESDIARQRLGGAPLSHRPYLLAAPVTGVEGLLLLARETTPFGEKDLWAVVELARRSARLLDDALAVRALARLLLSLADDD